MNYYAKSQGWAYLFFSPIALTGAVVTPVSWVQFTSPALAQTETDRKTEAESLLNLCREQLGKEQWEAAVESCQQAVTARLF